MIGDDHLAGTSQLFCAPNLVGQHAHARHYADEAPEQSADGTPGAALMTGGAAGQAIEYRKNEQSQAQAAHPEQGKADAGCQEPPVISVTAFLQWLRCQFHNRLLQGCRQAD
ncbi:hypothetical protein ALP29_200713 [Pseudomonas syringae pv. avii]|uniref:Uncharacterized protein n=1 Tax=Pseudomonas syringae pv. avii TaxID=663959 RepID=A0A3M5VC13_PSESX|nr:hypothetical protein ALP29_200713 [Pseudomonas syringae pv. avii]